MNKTRLRCWRWERAWNLLAMGGVFWLSSVACLGATDAAAQDVLLLPGPAVQGPVGAQELRAATVEAIAAAGLRLVPAPDGPDCEDADCIRELVRRAGASAALLVSWATGEEREQDVALWLQWIAGTGEARSVRESLAPGGLVPTAALALTRVLEIVQRSPRGWLVVHTVPSGAEVVVDGLPLGRTPLRRRLSEGPHLVRLGRADGETLTRRVEIEAGVEETLSIGSDDRDSSEGAEGSEGRAPGGPEEPSLLNWLLSGGLAVGGVVTLISPLQTLATEGQCVRLADEGGCAEQVAFGVESGVLLALGLTALGAAIVVDAVVPFRVQVAAGAERATIGVSVHF